MPYCTNLMQFRAIHGRRSLNGGRFLARPGCAVGKGFGLGGPRQGVHLRVHRRALSAKDDMDAYYETRHLFYIVT